MSRPASPLGRAALTYARLLGWPVLPLWWPTSTGCACGRTDCGKNTGKHPLHWLAPHGVKDATTDPEVITRWWRRFPHANVAIAMGRGMWALDIDPRNGGDDTLAELESRFGELPDTPRQLTGGLGFHFLFSHPEGFDVAKSIGPGIDCKGAGGYIVAAPSLHPSGRHYVWDSGAHPTETPIAEPPEWLVRLVVARPKVDHGPATGKAAESFLARAFKAAGWLGATIDDERVIARCPWCMHHPDGRGHGADSSTIIYAPRVGRPLGSFYCSHQNTCGKRRQSEVIVAIPVEALASLVDELPVESAIALAVLMSRRDAA